MTLLDSLLDAIVRLDGEALIMHVGEKPYVVLSSSSLSDFRGPLSWGQVELSSRPLSSDAVMSMLGQMLSADQRRQLDELGAIEHEIDAPGAAGERFVVTAARGGDDVWVEVRRRSRMVESDAGAASLPGAETGAAAAAESPALMDVAAPTDVAAAESPDLHGETTAGEQAAAAAAEAQAVREATLAAEAQAAALAEETRAAQAAGEAARAAAAQAEEARAALAAREAALAAEAQAALAVKEAALAADARAALAAREEALAAAARAELAATQEALAAEARAALVAKEEALAAHARAELAAKEEALAAEARAVLVAKEEALAAHARAELAAQEEALAAEAAAALEAHFADLAARARAEFERRETELARAAEVSLAERAERLAAEAAERDAARVAAAEAALADRLAALAADAERTLATREAALAAAAERALAENAAALRAEASATLAAREAELQAAAAREVAARAAATCTEVEATLWEKEASLARAAEASLAEKAAALAAEAAAAFAEKERALTAAAEAALESRLAALAAEHDAALAAQQNALAAEAETVLAQRMATIEAETRAAQAALEADARATQAMLEADARATQAALEADARAAQAMLESEARAAQAALAADREAARAAQEAARQAEAALGERLSALEADARAAHAALEAEREAARAVHEAALAAEVALEERLAALEAEERAAQASRDAEFAALHAAQVAAEAVAAARAEDERRALENAEDAALTAELETIGADAQAEEPEVAVLRTLMRPSLKLHPPPPLAAPAASTEASLVELLRSAASHRASTVYAVVDTRPMMRVEGQINVVGTESAIAAGDVERFIFEFAPRNLVADTAPEWTCTVPGVGKVRCVTFHDQAGAGLIFHLPTADVSSADELGLGPEVQSLCGAADGLIVITGPRASGKSSMLNALVDVINRTRYEHVITIESRIRVRHERRHSFISQREVRGDGDAIAAAARSALREGADVLVIEDLRAPEALAAALDAARAGRLVLGSISAPTAPVALERLVDAFPADRRPQLRASLAGALRAVVAQVLVPRIGGGRAAAREVLLSSPAVRKLLLEGSTGQLPIAIESGRSLGMRPMVDALGALVRDGVVSLADACGVAPDRAVLIAALERDGVDVSGVERRA